VSFSSPRSRGVRGENAVAEGLGADGAAPHNGTMPRITAAAPLWLVRRMVPDETQAKLDAVLSPGGGPRPLRC
jgi:hypothetical protein